MREVLGRGRRRTWSDWAGFALFLVMGVSILVRTPSIGVLLLPFLVHEFLVAATFLVRGTARGHLPGVGPKLAAYGATFLVPGFVLFASSYRPGWMPPPAAGSTLPLIGIALWFWGAMFAIYGVWCLRRSFSVEPYARELRASGPYEFARHPIYASYFLQYAGLFLVRSSLPFLLVLLVWLVVVLVRIRFEEMVLEAAFPEYAEYRRRVGMFCPRLRRAPVDRTAASVLGRQAQEAQRVSAGVASTWSSRPDCDEVVYR